MKLYYHNISPGNFGDDLNAWLWEKIIPGGVEGLFDEETLLVGIGSIVNEYVPMEPKKIVLGSGYAYERLPVIDESWKIYSVRGPLTARALGLDVRLGCGDGALLGMAHMPSAKRESIGFMPHHLSDLNGWARICEAHELLFIDPTKGVPEALDLIASCKKLITESMHGAIVADMMRIPWIGVTTSSAINEFKWQDWMASVDVETRLLPLSRPLTESEFPTGRYLARQAKNFMTCDLRLSMIKKRQGVLSQEAALSNAIVRSNQALEEMVSDGTQ